MPKRWCRRSRNLFVVMYRNVLRNARFRGCCHFPPPTPYSTSTAIRAKCHSGFCIKIASPSFRPSRPAHVTNLPVNKIWNLLWLMTVIVLIRTCPGSPQHHPDTVRRSTDEEQPWRMAERPWLRYRVGRVFCSCLSLVSIHHISARDETTTSRTAIYTQYLHYTAALPRWEGSGPPKFSLGGGLGPAVGLTRDGPLRSRVWCCIRC